MECPLSISLMVKQLTVDSMLFLVLNFSISVYVCYQKSKLTSEYPWHSQEISNPSTGDLINFHGVCTQKRRAQDLSGELFHDLASISNWNIWWHKVKFIIKTDMYFKNILEKNALISPQEYLVALPR